MNHSSYVAEDLVLNPEFRSWVTNPTSASNSYWENWLKENPGKVDEVKKAKDIIKKFPVAYHRLDQEAVDDMWSVLKNAAVDESSPQDKKTYPLNADTVISHFEKEQSKPNAGVWWKKSMRYAAILSMLIGVFAVFLALKKDYEKESAYTSAPMIVKKTQRGQKSTIYLNDGSKVILNSSSKLVYPKHFSAEDRVVKLRGEAYFEVAKDAKRPFRVQSGDITTTALGTSFNVNTRGPQVHVALTTGKVSVVPEGKDEQAQILLPGQDARYDEYTGHLTRGTFDVDLITAWKDQVLLFKKASEKQVFDVLQQWYAVDIEVTNKPKRPWEYSGEFKKMDLANVLLSIGFTMDFTYDITDQKVTITYN